MIETLFNSDMASDESNKLVLEMCKVLKEKRLKLSKKTQDKTQSLRSFAAESGLDPSMISRAEDSDDSKRRVPSINFWFDWCLALGTTLPKVIKEAEQRLKK